MFPHPIEQDGGTMSASTSRRVLWRTATILLGVLAMGSCIPFTCRGPSFLLPLTQGSLRSAWNALVNDTQLLYDKYLPPALSHGQAFRAQADLNLAALDLPANGMPEGYPIGVTWTQADEDLLDYLLGGAEDPIVSPMIQTFQDPSLWTLDSQGSSALTRDLQELEGRWAEASLSLDAATASLTQDNVPQFFIDLKGQSEQVRDQLDGLSFLSTYESSMKDAWGTYSAATSDVKERGAWVRDFAGERQANPVRGMRQGSLDHAAGWDGISNLYGAKLEAIAAIQTGYQLAVDLQAHGDPAEVEAASAESAMDLDRLHEWIEGRRLQTWGISDYFAAGPALHAESAPDSCISYATFLETPCAASGDRFNIDLTSGTFYWDDDYLRFDYAFLDDTDIAPAFTVGTGQVPEGMFAQLAINANLNGSPVEDYPLLEPMGGATAFAWWYPFDHTTWASYVRGPLDQVIVGQGGQTQGVDVIRVDDGIYSFVLAIETFEDLLLGEDLVAVTLQWYNGIRVDQIVIICEEAILVERPIPF
jgi:hypothetical protein